jgi:hypothetical protein
VDSPCEVVGLDPELVGIFTIDEEADEFISCLASDLSSNHNFEQSALDSVFVFDSHG